MGYHEFSSVKTTGLHVSNSSAVGVLDRKYDIIPFIDIGIERLSSLLMMECVEGFPSGDRCIGTSSTMTPYERNWFGQMGVFLILLPMYIACPKMRIVVMPVSSLSIAVSAVTTGTFFIVSS